MDGNFKAESSVPAMPRTTTAFVAEFDGRRDEHEVEGERLRRSEAVAFKAFGIEADVITDDAGVPPLAATAISFRYRDAKWLEFSMAERAHRGAPSSIPSILVGRMVVGPCSNPLSRRAQVPRSQALAACSRLSRT
jgi:hypothetical protein